MVVTNRKNVYQYLRMCKDWFCICVFKLSESTGTVLLKPNCLAIYFSPFLQVNFMSLASHYYAQKLFSAYDRY